MAASELTELCVDKETHDFVCASTFGRVSVSAIADKHDDAGTTFIFCRRCGEIRKIEFKTP